MKSAQGAQELAALLGSRPLSVEVVTVDLEEMLQQGRDLTSLAPNIMVKIPVENTTGQPCLGVIHRLAQDGVKMNTSACLSVGQAMLAAKAQVSYVSCLVGASPTKATTPSESSA